jgi:hypothetical protein
VAQEDSFTPANVEIGDQFVLTITGEDGTTNAVSFTATAATVANVTAGLATAWNASTHRLCTPITAADATTSMTLTADTAGVPFAVAATTTDGGGSNTQTLTRAAVTPNVSSSDWNYAANWSGNAVPVSSDNVTLDARMVNAILYGLNQSAVTLAAFKHYRGAKALGSADAVLRISITAGDINLPPDDGSTPSAGFVRLDTGTNATALNFWGSGTSLSGVLGGTWKGVHASNIVNIYDGTVGIATAAPGDAATLPTLNVVGTNAKAVVASGVTLTTANLESGGKATIQCAATTINVVDANCSLRHEGSGAVTTINCNGSGDIRGTGTITTLSVEDGGKVTTRSTNNARTITNAIVYGGGTYTTDLNTTHTNGIDCVQGADTSQVSIFGSGSGVTVTPSAA